MPRIRVSTQTLLAEDGQEQENELQDLQVNSQCDNVTLSVVKMKLNSFLQEASRKQLKDRIEKLVEEMNILVGEAYLFANFHIIRLLDAGSTVPQIDRSFYYRCLVACGNNKSGLPDDMIASLLEFDGLRPPVTQTTDPPTDSKPAKKTAKVKKVCRLPDSRKVNVTGTEYNQLLADLSIVMSTMATNHLWINLAPRLKRFLKWARPLVKPKLRNYIVKAVVDEPKSDLQKVFQIKEVKRKKVKISYTEEQLAAALTVAQELRELLPLPSKNKPATQAHLTLKLYHMMLRETEDAKETFLTGAASGRFKGRVYTLLPVKAGFVVNNLQFSTMTLLSLLKKTGLETFHGDGRDVDPYPLWKKYFNLNAVETATRKFRGRIVTDGCAVSIVMNKPSCLVCPSSELDDSLLREAASSPEIKTCGVDPGVTDVVNVAYSNGSTASYSAARYYEKAKYNLSRRRVNKWNSETAEQTASLSNGCKTTSRERLAAYIQSYLHVVRDLTIHRMSKGYRNMRFMRYCGKQQAIEEICDVVAPKGNKWLVGFGDWSGLGSTPISRRCAGPLQEIKLALSKRYNAILKMIQEFRSSITCHGCHNRLCNMSASQIVFKRGANGAPKERVEVVRKVHKILHCKSSANGSGTRCCGATWNRDTNAAKNILMLFQTNLAGLDRPAAFCRQQCST